MMCKICHRREMLECDDHLKVTLMNSSGLNLTSRGFGDVKPNEQFNSELSID